MDKFNPNHFYSKDQIDTLAGTLKKERVEWLDRFPTLNPKVRV